MIPRFSLARPSSLAEAFAAHAATDGEGAYVAGGTELLQVMKMGLAQFATLIDIKGLPELRGISVEADGSLRIGAGVTHREIERSPLVQQHLPALASLEAHLANVRVRNQGTLGGNLAFAEPHSDPATFLLACDARVELAGPGGSRLLAIDELVLGPLYTSREADELLVAIHVPAAGPGGGRGYEKAKFFERPAVAVGVQLRVADGAVADARVAVGSITEVPMLVPAAAAALAGAGSEAAVAEAARAGAAAAFADLDAVDDLNGAADYKRHLAGVLLQRAAVAAYREASKHA
ncbi:MAG TPA: FAD binding domain-containing protein [Candidatus Limnocylindrales bacterium]|nr:FAD binding domain-containing protein [Candidatus Limnocylindrales bacterium]